MALGDFYFAQAPAASLSGKTVHFAGAAHKKKKPPEGGLLGSHTQGREGEWLGGE
jgi:hypothetical protein